MVKKQVTLGAWLAILAISRQQPEDRVFLGWRTSTQGGPNGHIFWFLFNIQLSYGSRWKRTTAKWINVSVLMAMWDWRCQIYQSLGSPQLSHMGDIEIAFFDVRNPLYCKMRF